MHKEETKGGRKDPARELEKKKEKGSRPPPLRKPLPGFPGGGPRGSGGGASDPIDRFGAGVGKFVGTITQVFANGIPPDVAGNFLYLIGRPKNVVVITRFPESAAVGFAKTEGRALFEEADKIEAIAAGMRTFDKNMKVIRHQTVGMKPVRVAGGAFEQQRKNNVSGGFLGGIGRTMVTANGDEIGFATEVVFRR